MRHEWFLFCFRSSVNELPLAIEDLSRMFLYTKGWCSGKLFKGGCIIEPIPVSADKKISWFGTHQQYWSSKVTQGVRYV